LLTWARILHRQRSPHPARRLADLLPRREQQSRRRPQGSPGHLGQRIPPAGRPPAPGYRGYQPAGHDRRRGERLRWPSGPPPAQHIAANSGRELI